MAFDYSKLRGKIAEKFGSQSVFAKELGCSERTLSLKMNGKISWKQTEMLKAMSILGISEEDIHDYFFTLKVQNF